MELLGVVYFGSGIDGTTMTTAPKRAKSKATTQKYSDLYLIEECLKGNESAWSLLIDKYKNLIFSIPIRYGFSQEDSADIFQAVCIDLLAELPRLREPKALPAWLIQVSRNKCFRRKQTLQRNRVQEIDDFDLPAESVKEPENLIALVQQEQLVREALSELSSQCRQLVEMLFFEDPPRPYEQVAKQLKLAPGSIGFTRRNCLDKIKERLETLGY
jgi:RNA polymerase sigma factor (sigma-70 family)